MVTSSAPASGLSALDQLIEQFIYTKPAPQAAAIPQDTVTLSRAASPQPAPAPEVPAASKAGSATRPASPRKSFAQGID